jgi:hypothetical protein
MHVILTFQLIVKVMGCACGGGGAEFILLRIPTSVGFYAHVMNAVSQN